MTSALVLALLLAAPAAAADAVIDKVSGQVHYKPYGSGRYKPAHGGEELLFGDAVKTGPGALAHVVLKDRGAVLVRESTELTLQGSPSQVVISVALGEFLVGIKKRLEKGTSFRVRTPAAVAAVRGTLFWGRTDGEKTSYYAGFGHEIAVTAQKKTVIVGPGRKTMVKLGKPPESPDPSDVSLGYAKNFAIDGSLQDLESLVDKESFEANRSKKGDPAEPAPSPAAPKKDLPLPGSTR